MNPTCETCRWWDVYPGNDRAECHRHAPHGAGWHITRGRNWCGDHEELVQIGPVQRATKRLASKGNPMHPCPYDGCGGHTRAFENHRVCLRCMRPS